MTLTAGTRLGPYEILSPIGAGGMGEVYRARDPRLNRDVAIKVLPASYSEDPDRLRRFEHEAKAAGVLNHPNITAVYDFGQAEGAPYVVQELLEGETLRAALAGGSLSPRRAVDYAIGIAHGLAAAHEKGIVHRDLKPENLFITNAGQIKILDFGLAKLTEPAGGGTQTNLPTAAPATEPGIVLGTLGYMSPEQVRGKAADHRSDIFSFGAILYEMLSGKRAFHADSAADTMSAILKEDPPELSINNPNVPPALERIIRHCLEKTPERRLHSAHDLAFELESLTQTSGAAAVVPASRLRGSLRAALLAVAAAAAIAAAFALGRRGTHSGDPAAARREYRQLTSLSGYESNPALSPDGQLLAFSRFAGAAQHVFVQRVTGQSLTDLTPDCEARSALPSFSPDGSLIAYSTQCGGGGIRIVGASGENERRLTTFGDAPAWSPDGREIVFGTESGWSPYNRSSPSELWVAEVATGKTRKIPVEDAVQPSVSPHGWRIAYWGLPATGSHRDLWTVPFAGLAKGESPVAVTQDPAVDWNPAWSSDGRFLYFLSDRDGSMNLWRVPIDERSGRTLGPPEPRTLPARDVEGFAISRDGRRMAYVAAEQTYAVDRVVIDPARGEVREPATTVMESSRAISQVMPSPDGKLLVFDSQGSVREDIFVMQADGSRGRRLMDDAARDRTPSFLGGGERILFQSDRGGSWDFWTILPDGSGLTQLTRDTGMTAPVSSPDGRRVAGNDGTSAAVFALDEHGTVQSSLKLPLLSDGIVTVPADFTPDGRKLLCGTAQKDGSVTGVVFYDFERGAWDAPVPLAGNLASIPTPIGPDGLIGLTSEGLSLWKLSGGPARLLLPRPRNGNFASQSVARNGSAVYLPRFNESGDIWLATPP